MNKLLTPERVTVQGHVMYLDEGDSLGLSVSGEYESAETRIIQEHIKKDQVVLDIGANIGYFTLIFARLVGDKGKVYAFEPDPVTYKILKRNIQANRYRNVIAEPAAVSNMSAQAFLRRDQFNNLDHQLVPKADSMTNIEVKTIRLDDYFTQLSEPVDFIKIDIQGAEVLALDGMHELLSKSKHIKVLTEFWPVGLERVGGVNGGARYLHQLENLSFVIFEIDKKTGALLQRSSQELLRRYQASSREYTNLLCVKNCRLA